MDAFRNKKRAAYISKLSLLYNKASGYHLSVFAHFTLNSGLLLYLDKHKKVSI
jgi:hypothetical protein